MKDPRRDRHLDHDRARPLYVISVAAELAGRRVGRWSHGAPTLS